MSTILAVAQRGEAILKCIASPVLETEFNSRWLHELAQSMHATMQIKSGVGIAAPQVYVSKRVIIVASRPNLRYPDAPEMDAVVMLNPEILEISEQMLLGEEGCLSVEGERGQVARADTIRVRYFTLVGAMMEVTLSGFPARIVQHEVDHLNGILFVDRL